MYVPQEEVNTQCLFVQARESRNCKYLTIFCFNVDFGNGKKGSGADLEALQLRQQKDLWETCCGRLSVH